MESDPTRPNDDDGRLAREIEELIALLRRQTAAPPASGAACDCELEACLLEKIARLGATSATQSHRMARSLENIERAMTALLALQQSVHPEQALQAQRLAALEAELRRCCPPEDPVDDPCVDDEPCRPNGGRASGDGHSVKSTGHVDPVRVSDHPHEPWQIVFRGLNEEDDELPRIPRGRFTEALVPSAPTPRAMDFRSGPATPPGSQAPVTFRRFSESDLAANWPPDMSGARGGDVVLMSGNLWLKISVDGGGTFADLDFTTLFAADNVYGGWAGDQVIHYVPAIDCFVLYVQAYTPTSGANMNKNVVKVALASQADLKTFSGGRQAWRRQWDFTSDDFGLGASWMDFPDVSYGDRFVHFNTNVFAARPGKLFFELPLVDLVAGRGFAYQFGFIDKGGGCGSPIQNILGDTNYWAQHVSNTSMRIYSSRGGEATFAWRERDVRPWPITTDNDIVSPAPDSNDWVSEDHRIIGATRVQGQLWFAWTAANGDGGHGGFSFPHPHVQIAKFDLFQDFKLLDQIQIWNADHAFTYPCLTTNADGEVGISIGWGGGSSKFFGSHAVGILGDFVVWYGALSDATVLRQKVDGAGQLVVDAKGNPVLDQTRWGDYVHVRLAHPDTRYFSAFGYSVRKDPSVAAPGVGKFEYAYIEFGRELPAPAPGLH